MRQNIWKKVLGQSHSLIWERNCLVNGKYTNRMQFFSKWIKLLLLLLFGLLCCSFIVFIVTPPVASWDRKIRSADQIFDLEIVIRSTDRIFDLEIVIPSADRIFDLEIIIRSADRIFDLEIELSSFNTFYLILKIKQMSPLGFGMIVHSNHVFL